MKRILSVFLMLAVLVGCGAAEPTWETVDDAAAAPIEADIYTIFVPLGFEANFVPDETSGTQVYTDASGDYTVTLKTYLADDLNSAVRQLTGFSADELQLQQTERHGMAEYRFAWYAAADGGRVCRADLIRDDSRWYACVFAVDEAAGGRYAKLISDAFSHLTLSQSEGF